MISSDVVGIIGCHHGLHLHQVLLHLCKMNDGFSQKRLILSVDEMLFIVLLWFEIERERFWTVIVTERGIRASANYTNRNSCMCEREREEQGERERERRGFGEFWSWCSRFGFLCGQQNRSAFSLCFLSRKMLLVSLSKEHSKTFSFLSLVEKDVTWLVMREKIQSLFECVCDCFFFWKNKFGVLFSSVFIYKLF